MFFFNRPQHLSIMLSLIVGMAINTNGQARLDFVPNGSSVSGYSHSIVQSPFGNPCPPEEDISDSQGTFNTLPTGRIYGGAFTYIKRGVPNCKISSQGTANVLIDGDGGNVIFVRWWCHSNTQYDCHDPQCGWTATDSSSVSATVKLAIDGLPNGTPVQVTYFWKHFSSYANEPEAGNEDEAAVAGTSLNLFNQVGFGNNMSIGGSLQFAQLRTGNDPQVLNMLVGDTLQIDVSGMTHANIDPPAKPINNPREDDASSDFFGYCYIYINGPNSPVVSVTDTCDDESIYYSIDIGSDMEISDPTPDGSEILDPGDVYDATSGSLVPVMDDATLFGFDPAPNIGNPALTCSAGPLQSSQHVLNFDVDGTDRVDYSLSTNAGSYGAGLPSISMFNSECIHGPEYALVSFDEDRGINFNSAINCNVPSSFDPSDSTFARGAVNNHDEVMVVHLSQSQGTTDYTGTAMPYKNEEDLTGPLAPSPPSRFPADLNDDVDALDLVADPTICDNYYFSVDHEAQYIYQNDTLDPGAIYEFTAGGLIAKVIDPILELGLLPGVDIDAFEFTWLYDFNQQRYGLALAFSVSDSDPFSLVDYTGGLDPDFIYASFLDGISFQMVGGVSPNNIDALAFSCEPFLPYGSTFVNPNIIVGLQEPQAPNNEIVVYPNPTNGDFDIRFKLSEQSEIGVILYDLKGRVVKSANMGTKPTGSSNISMSLTGLSQGLYFLESRISSELTGEIFRLRQKVLLSK